MWEINVGKNKYLIDLHKMRKSKRVALCPTYFLYVRFNTFFLLCDCVEFL